MMTKASAERKIELILAEYERTSEAAVVALTLEDGVYISHGITAAIHETRLLAVKIVSMPDKRQ